MARVLVIEDNPINLELVVYLLQAMGHETLTASNGDAGIQAARHHLPELVLCDIQMPGTDGYGVAHALKADAALARIPLVAVSALAMVGDREKSVQAGFDDHLSKPIDPPAFMAAVTRFLQMGQDRA